MLLVVLVATVACFALVGASAKTEQVTVHGTLEADSRAAYDLLVRPAGSASAAERQGNLVSSTAMSSIDGGITLAQWHKIEQIPGVYAAAPVAVVGYDYLEYDVTVHVPGPPKGQSQVLYRLAPEFSTPSTAPRSSSPPTTKPSPNAAATSSACTTATSPAARGRRDQSHGWTSRPQAGKPPRSTPLISVARARGPA